MSRKEKKIGKEIEREIKRKYLGNMDISPFLCVLNKWRSRFAKYFPKRF
jgi:hypothetical protein